MSVVDNNEKATFFEKHVDNVHNGRLYDVAKRERVMALNPYEGISVSSNGRSMHIFPPRVLTQRALQHIIAHS